MLLITSVLPILCNTILLKQKEQYAVLNIVSFDEGDVSHWKSTSSKLCPWFYVFLNFHY